VAKSDQSRLKDIVQISERKVNVLLAPLQEKFREPNRHEDSLVENRYMTGGKVGTALMRKKRLERYGGMENGNVKRISNMSVMA